MLLLLAAAKYCILLEDLSFFLITVKFYLILWALFVTSNLLSVLASLLSKEASRLIVDFFCQTDADAALDSSTGDSKRVKGLGIGGPDGPVSLDDVRRLQRSNEVISLF